MVYKELELLPAYTPYFVIDQFKEYLAEKDVSEFSFCSFENVMSLVNFAKAIRNITGDQAIELKKILKKNINWDNPKKRQQQLKYWKIKIFSFEVFTHLV